MARNTTMSGRHPMAGSGIALLLAGVLAACGSDEHVREPAPIRGLETHVVAVAGTGAGRAWDGVVEAVRQATLTAQTSGRVAGVMHDVNDRVVAGDVLVRLSAVEQQAGVDAARAQLRLAEATYQRMSGLAEGRYVSKMQLDQARAERDAARAQLANVGQQSAYTTIRSPYAGLVATRNVEPGESVGVGQPLVTIFAPDALRIEVSVPQSQADAIRAHPHSTITFDDGRQVAADDVTVFPAADPATHAVKVRVQLPPLDPVPQPGRTAKVAFPALAGDAYPRIPAAALVRRGETRAVYVLADGRLSLRQLRLGERRGGDIDVIAGLKPGEVIAIDPVAALQALVAARQGD
ncbi:MAG: efflux RND transporter periplasmic adaptor subunit [Proteobacteria bacterium]|nr:efflux RND transporter periplasmic adaptor subunit [Pseudomonadota bacterium]